VSRFPSPINRPADSGRVSATRPWMELLLHLPPCPSSKKLALGSIRLPDLLPPDCLLRPRAAIEGWSDLCPVCALIFNQPPPGLASALPADSSPQCLRPGSFGWCCSTTNSASAPSLLSIVAARLRIGLIDLRDGNLALRWRGDERWGWSWCLVVSGGSGNAAMP